MKYIFRFHKGGLDESLKTLKEFETEDEIINYVKESELYGYLKPKTVTIDSNIYAKEDKRIGWKNIRLVLFDNKYPIGWVGEMEDERDNKTSKRMG